MKLEYLPDLTKGGKYSPYITELVRLWDFREAEAKLFWNALNYFRVSSETSFDLGNETYIQPLNCNVLFVKAEADLGLRLVDCFTFYCELSLLGIQYACDVAKVFIENPNGYHFLYDTWENPNLSAIEFLISPYGTW